MELVYDVMMTEFIKPSLCDSLFSLTHLYCECDYSGTELSTAYISHPVCYQLHACMHAFIGSFIITYNGTFVAVLF